MFCPECGRDNREDAKFCAACGTEVEDAFREEADRKVQLAWKGDTAGLDRASSDETAGLYSETDRARLDDTLIIRPDEISYFKTQYDRTAEIGVCAECGRKNALTAVYCAGCGTQLAAAADSEESQGDLANDAAESCPTCGNENLANAKFCKACGTPLHETPAAGILSGTEPDKPEASHPKAEADIGFLDKALATIKSKKKELLPATAIGALVLAVVITGTLVYLSKGKSESSIAAQSDSSIVSLSMFHANPQHTGVFFAGVRPTGMSDWRYTTGGKVTSSPAIAGRNVFVGSWDGNFYAVDSMNGAKNWEFKAGGSISSSPAVSNEAVYFGSWDGKLYAVNGETGAKKWEFKTGDKINSDPTVANGKIFIGSNDGNLYAIDASTGSEIWRYPTGKEVQSSPAISNGVVFFGSLDGNLYAVSEDSGEEQWKFGTEDGISSAPAIVDGTAYFGSWDGNLYAVDCDDGDEVWKFNTGARITSSPAVMNGVVYIGSTDKNIYAVSADSGEEKWKFEAADSIESSPSLAGSTLYVGGADSNLYAIDLESGREKWKFKTDAGISSSAAIATGTVFFGSMDGNLYAPSQIQTETIMPTEPQAPSPEPAPEPEPGPPSPEEPSPSPQPAPLPTPQTPQPQLPKPQPQPLPPSIPTPTSVPAPAFIKTFSTDNQKQAALPGRLLISGNGYSDDTVAQLTHNNMWIAYSYFKNTFNRDSLDSKGMTVVSSVHYIFEHRPGEFDINNAAWMPYYNQFAFADGDGQTFSPLGYSVDVAAHEYTHGVTTYTTNFSPFYTQSSALNESFSDVFGVMVDRNDWLIGEDVITPETPGDALRSLEDPTLYGQPANMKDYVPGGDSHVNSGIPNKAAFNVANVIGRDKTEQIWYRAVTVGYMTKYADFADAKDACAQAAADLYGPTGPEVAAVKNGFAAVGIGTSVPHIPVTTTATPAVPSVNTTPTSTTPAGLSVDENAIAMPGADASRSGFFDNDKQPVGTLNKSFDYESGLIADGVLFADGGAVGLSSGKTYWQFDMPAGGSGGSKTPVTEAIVNGVAYLTTYTQQPGNKYAAGLHAVDVETGKENWKFEEPGMLESVTVGENGIYIAVESLISGTPSSTTSVIALSIDEGTELWRVSKDGDIGYDMAYANDVVYFGGGFDHSSKDKNFYAMDAETGKEKWRYATEGNVTSPPALDDKRAYFVISDDKYGKKLNAVDLETGKKDWSFALGNGKFGVNSAPSIKDGTVFIGIDVSDTNMGEYAVLYAVDSESGKEKWKFDAGQMPNDDRATGAMTPLYPSPAISGDVVYFSGADRNLYALDMTSGKEKWKYAAQGRLGRPMLSGGQLYFTSKGKLYVLD